MTLDEVLVIGHRNPDTDAICAAVGYADFKQRTGMTQAVAARCGDIGERTAFVLESFGVPPPRFVADVSPKIRDVMQMNIIHLPRHATLMEALSLMDERKIRILPVVGAAGTCDGFVSVFKMTKFLCPAPDRLFESRRVVTSVRNLASTLHAQVVVRVPPDLEEELILLIAAMSPEAFKRELAKYPPHKLIVIAGDQIEVIEAAIKGKVRVIVATGGLEIEESLLQEAFRQKVSLVISPYDTTTSVMLCRASVTIEHMIHEQFLTFREDEALHDARTLAISSHFQAFPVLDAQKKMIGILSKSDFLKRVGRQLILVDHNELSQAVQGAEQVEILEIIDHHRLGVLTSRQPILFRNEPVGSTSTIVADCFFRSNVELTASIAGLLLAGLVSDTLNLTSPTTTEHDTQILRKLEKIAGVDASRFTEKLFASGSILTSKAVDEAILADCKEFTEQGRTFSAAQIEELGFEEFWKRQQEVMSALENYRAKKGYSFSALLITDVIRQTSLLLLTGDPALLRKIDYPSLQPGIFELPGVVSRKKQMLPYLTDCLERLGERRQAPEPLTMV